MSNYKLTKARVNLEFRKQGLQEIADFEKELLKLEKERVLARLEGKKCQITDY
jgi:hypothetical protein